MAVQQPTEVALGTGTNRWIAAVVAGIVSAIAFGLVAVAMLPEMIDMIGAMYGFEGNATVGWIAHLFHGAVFGLVFAAIVSLDRLRGHASKVAYGAGLGIVYGVIVWVIAASIVMPIWLGTPEAVPDFNLASLLGHVVYGVILGSMYPLIVRWMQ